MGTGQLSGGLPSCFGDTHQASQIQNIFILNYIDQSGHAWVHVQLSSLATSGAVCCILFLLSRNLRSCRQQPCPKENDQAADEANVLPSVEYQILYNCYQKGVVGVQDKMKIDEVIKCSNIVVI